MTTFRDRAPVIPGTTPVLPNNLSEMLGSSGPGDSAGAHDTANFLVLALRHAAQVARQEAQLLQAEGDNRVPTYDPAKIELAIDVARKDMPHIPRPRNNFETPTEREARKSVFKLTR